MIMVVALLAVWKLLNVVRREAAVLLSCFSFVSVVFRIRCMCVLRVGLLTLCSRRRVLCTVLLQCLLLVSSVVRLQWVRSWLVRSRCGLRVVWLVVETVRRLAFLVCVSLLVMALRVWCRLWWC